MKKQTNYGFVHDEHVHGGQWRLARLQVHWLRGRLAATAGRFDYQAMCDWERKVVNKLNRAELIDSRLNIVARSFPNEMQVFDVDYGYGKEDAMDRDIRSGLDGNGRDIQDGHTSDEEPDGSREGGVDASS